MMSTTKELYLSGTAQLLINDNFLDKNQAIEYQQLAKISNQTFLYYLCKNYQLPALRTAQSIATHFALPFIDLDTINKDNIPLQLIDELLIRRHHFVPLYTRGNHLFLAMDDPSQHASLKEIQFHTGFICNILIAETDKLHTLIDKLLHNKIIQGLCDYAQSSPPNNLAFDSTTGHSPRSITDSADEAPVVKFVNQTIINAIKQGASDIHFEPYEHRYRIRYRLDGVLSEVVAPTSTLANQITSRIKVMSNLDISERRIPQDGQFKMNLKRLSQNHTVDLRVSTCPTLYGEKVVLRILDPLTEKLSIETLGLNLIQKQLFLHAINKPQGMILVTGPTGSGKTVTLYTALNILNTQERNISSVEDPVEIKVPGINQVNINPKAGLSFAKTLRAFLRQDPDIIMVGEIRDCETAEIAIQAAQTGHLVLSTLHTNSASETITRLLNMGIPSFNIASSISLIIAQRLARKLCLHCRIKRHDFTLQSLLELGFTPEHGENITLYKAQGCEHCHQGYRGRVGLFEVMPVSKTLGKLIMSNKHSLDIFKQARQEKLLTLYQSGLEKIKEGLTTIEEINRVTRETD